MPAIPLSATKESGHQASWVNLGGWPIDPAEESPDLIWPHSVKVYDRMRRQDAQVRGVLWGVTLPMRRPIWSLDPQDAKPQIVSELSEDLGLPILGGERPMPSRRRGRISWAEFLRLGLLSLSYGHMAFEPVYDERALRETGKARLRLLAPRFPATIQKINVDVSGELTSIVQHPAGELTSAATGPELKRPTSLAFFSVDREGAAWQGQSILRAAYKHWLLKDREMRVMAITHERNGMGVPIAEGPPNASDAQLADLAKLAQSYRAGEASGGAIPNGARLRLVGVDGTLPDPLPAINYHDTSIAKGVWEQFIQLGTGGSSGNRALGGVFFDFFAMAVDSLANELADQVTTEVVEHLVALNYGEDEPAPAIVVREVDAEADIQPAALSALIAAGAITMDDELEAYLRGRYRLPARGTSPGRPVPSPSPPAPPAPIQARRGGRQGRAVRAAGVTRRVRFANRLEAYYADQLQLAFAALVDPREVARRFVDSVAAARDAAVAAHAAATIRSLGLDDEALGTVVAEAWGESYVAGTHSALGQLPSGVEHVEPPWEAEVDWSTWQPGNAGAAAELAGTDGGRGLATMLAESDVRIQAMSDTTIELVAGQLADGVALGESQASLANRIEAMLGDRARAEMIARTEVNRAMTMASRDTYRDNGMAGRQWLAASDAEADCAALDGTIVAIDAEFAEGDPPLHPNCRCTILPVLAAEMPEVGALPEVGE